MVALFILLLYTLRRLSQIKIMSRIQREDYLKQWCLTEDSKVLRRKLRFILYLADDASSVLLKNITRTGRTDLTLERTNFLGKQVRELCLNDPPEQLFPTICYAEIKNPGGVFRGWTEDNPNDYFYRGAGLTILKKRPAYATQYNFRPQPLPDDLKNETSIS